MADAILTEPTTAPPTSYTWQTLKQALEKSTKDKEWKLSLGRTGSLSQDRKLTLFVAASKSGKVPHFAGIRSEIELDQTDLFRGCKEIKQFGTKASDQLGSHEPGSTWAAFETDGTDGFKIYCAEKPLFAHN